MVAPVQRPNNLSKRPKMHRKSGLSTLRRGDFDTSDIDLGEAIQRVLSLPSVASKNFLITIGDPSALSKED